MERLRTFIAVELPSAIRGELSGLQERLRSPNLSAKWVSTDNIHLTLKFLGSVELEKLPRANAALEDALKSERAFSFVLSGIGVFPSLSRPRVVWVGIKEGKEGLRRLTTTIENALEPIGFPKEKRGFSAHVTLSRIKREGKRGELREKLIEMDYRSDLIRVSSIAVMKSDLTPKGPIYTRLNEIRLG